MNFVQKQTGLARQLKRPQVRPSACVTPAELKAVQIIIRVDLVIARSLLKVGACDRERFAQVDISKTTQKIDLVAAAQAARFDAIQFNVIQLRLVIDIENIREEEIVRREPQVARDRQLASAAGRGLIGVPTEDSPIAQLPRTTERTAGRVWAPANQKPKPTGPVNSDYS